MSDTGGQATSREYVNQLRDAVAIARCVERDDNTSFDILASNACVHTLHALAFLVARLAIDLAEDFPSRFPAIDDVWADLLDRIDRIEVQP